MQIASSEKVDEPQRKELGQNSAKRDLAVDLRTPKKAVIGRNNLLH